MKKLILFLLSACLYQTAAVAQVIARFVVKPSGIARHNTAVHASLPEGAGNELVLEEITGKKHMPVPVSVQDGRLYWVLNGDTPGDATRTFELRKGHPRKDTLMKAVITNGHLLLEQAGQPVLQYNYNTVPAPAGADTVYSRSAFIHPLWAPNGVVLTNIFPNAGHLHHMGIWNPWTHTMFEGRETDFWNVQKKEGKVRYAGKLETFSGDVICGFSANQDHIAFLKNGSEKTALHETWQVKVYPTTNNGSRRIWDFTSIFTPATPAGITLLQYRYGGGFGLRTTAAFTASTSRVLTSEGKNRNEADSTRARWVKISGSTAQGKAGLLIMDHPDNFDYPQPLRVWPENMEGGELMFNFTPTRMKSWQLDHGTRYQLNYRVMVFDGDITDAEAEAAWKDFAFPPEVIVIQP
ncbi:PmoA family protein [Chitinophaga sp. 212800010-3]|uniref:DUF6807 domain-containing protein n=1 Tax=unclassified Chitinophaga TaxID=2619133 RepID=UPI002DF4B209|nr:Methane oxygenase PmoA [Chitinophaga sp. 212800010-3]